MSTIKRFEDLEVWKKAREFSKRIFLLTDKDTFKDFGLIKQIRNSSGSIMDNIAEGFERDGTREFIQFLSIAKGSVGESRSQLYRALDHRFINEAEFNEAYEKCIEISKMLKGFMLYLGKQDVKGVKFIT